MTSPYTPPNHPPPQHNTQPGYGYNQHQSPSQIYNMQGSQPYAQEYGQPNGALVSMPPAEPSHENYGYKQEKFEPKPRWNDLVFAILFLAQFGASLAISVIALRAVGLTAGRTGAGLGGTGGNSLTLDLHTAYMLVFICFAALVLSIGLLGLVRVFTKVILEICLLLSVVISVGYAIYLWTQKYWSGAIIFTIFAVISVIAYFPMRRRIPFSRQCLLLVLRIAGEYKSAYFVALLGTFVQFVYAVWWSFTITAAYVKWDPSGNGANAAGGSSGSGALICVCIFLVFSFYWTTQFLTNLFLTTEAGIFGTWYFTGGKNAGGPSHVAWGAFKRASTYSMGSIAFGSLIVALLDLLRAAINIAQTQASDSGDILGVICACIAGCCVSIITGLVEFFNRYAYIEIALYGKAYIPAAKDTWRLIKDRGIDALINDSLVNTIWTFGSYAVGVLCSLFAYLYLRVNPPLYIESNSNLTAVVLLYAFLVGFQITHSLGYGCLSAGVSTIFVGLAEDPQVLGQRDPVLFEMIRQTYPHVISGV